MQHTVQVSSESSYVFSFRISWEDSNWGGAVIYTFPYCPTVGRKVVWSSIRTFLFNRMKTLSWDEKLMLYVYIKRNSPTIPLQNRITDLSTHNRRWWYLLKSIVHQLLLSNTNRCMQARYIFTLGILCSSIVSYIIVCVISHVMTTLFSDWNIVCGFKISWRNFHIEGSPFLPSNLRSFKVPC